MHKKGKYVIGSFLMYGGLLVSLGCVFVGIAIADSATRYLMPGASTAPDVAALSESQRRAEGIRRTNLGIGLVASGVTFGGVWGLMGSRFLRSR